MSSEYKKEKYKIYLLNRKKRESERGNKINNEKNIKKRGIRLTNHAIERFNERLAPLGYIIDDVMNDIKTGWSKISLSFGGEYKIIGQIGIYIIAKDRITYDWIIITMRIKDI